VATTFHTGRAQLGGAAIAQSCTPSARDRIDGPGVSQQRGTQHHVDLFALQLGAYVEQARETLACSNQSIKIGQSGFDVPVEIAAAAIVVEARVEKVHANAGPNAFRAASTIIRCWALVRRMA
jgi:uncharacterized membrane protein